ncbi:MAG: alpha/beta hydrolase [bacterium]|nr:alpha/beta hydrolase [bacterium]MCP5065148.1 alpha/beta hydrolase [bacterium]
MRGPKETWPAILAGLLWLSHAFDAGWLGFAAAAVPGALLLGTGVPAFLLPGDLRLHQFMALGGVLGVVFGIGALFAVGPGAGLLLIALSAVSAVAAGHLTATMTPAVPGVPESPLTWRKAAEVAGDDLILSFMVSTMQIPDPGEIAQIALEIEEARVQFAERGVLEKPASYHRTPPLLEAPMLSPGRAGGIDYQHLRFESGYEPPIDEPGRDRWLSYAPNRTAHGWLLEHDAPGRPWIVCIHGYQMGLPLIDLTAFRAAELHHQLGMNVLLPILPFHGPRKIGRISGDGFLTGNAMDAVHAISQGLWDIRRMLSWIRERGGERIGVYGLSLGGYHTAALAGLESDLACVIPGIPAADFPDLIWRHGPPMMLRTIEANGIHQSDMREVMTPVSPLALTPVVAKERRTIFGATCDQLVPAEQVRDLWEHWDRPRIEWYPGAHLTFGLHENVRRVIRDAFRDAELTAGA